jgi:glutathione S-transferase
VEVKLYGTEESVYTRMVRLTLLAKKVAFALIEADPFEGGALPEDYDFRHPFKRIPVIEIDGVRLYETDPIVHYIDAAIENPKLTPSVIEDAARMRQVMRIVDNYAYRPLVWGFMFQSGGATGWSRHKTISRNPVMLWGCLNISLIRRLKPVSRIGPWPLFISPACLALLTV